MQSISLMDRSTSSGIHDQFILQSIRYAASASLSVAVPGKY